MKTLKGSVLLVVLAILGVLLGSGVVSAFGKNEVRNPDMSEDWPDDPNFPAWWWSRNPEVIQLVEWTDDESYDDEMSIKVGGPFLIDEPYFFHTHRYLLSVIDGQTYVAGIYVKSKGVTPGTTVQFCVDWWQNEPRKAFASSVKEYTFDTPDSDWVLVEVKAVAPAGATGAQLRIVIEPFSDGFIWFDAASFVLDFAW